jgi:cyclin T
MEDTPCLLKHVVIVAYETMYQKNPDAAKRIHQEVFNFLHL